MWDRVCRIRITIMWATIPNIHKKAIKKAGIGRHPRSGPQSRPLHLTTESRRSLSWAFYTTHLSRYRPHKRPSKSNHRALHMCHQTGTFIIAFAPTLEDEYCVSKAFAADTPLKSYKLCRGHFSLLHLYSLFYSNTLHLAFLAGGSCFRPNSYQTNLILYYRISRMSTSPSTN